MKLKRMLTMLELGTRKDTTREIHETSVGN